MDRQRFGLGSRERASEYNCEALALVREAIERLERAEAWIRASSETLQPPHKRNAA